MISNYIIGKRKRIYNPISFLIITVTIYLIVSSFHHIPHEKSEPKDNMPYKIGYEAAGFITHYLKYFWILGIFWLSLSFRLLFRKYTFAENLAISSFIIGYATLGALVGLFYSKVDLLFDPIVYLILMVMTYRIYSGESKDKGEILFKSVLSIVLFFIQLTTLVVLIGYLKVLMK